MHAEVVTEAITVLLKRGGTPAEQWPSRYGRSTGLMAITSHSEIMCTAPRATKCHTIDLKNSFDPVLYCFIVELYI